jgi:Transposase, Mutator family.
MMEAEMDAHLGYEKSERSDNEDSQNGYKAKQINSSYGSMKIRVPDDPSDFRNADGYLWFRGFRRVHFRCYG